MLRRWFDGAAGVLIGRTPAPDADPWTQADAVHDALGDLPCPVVVDVDFGHQQPVMSLVNGALATVTIEGLDRTLTQEIAPE